MRLLVINFEMNESAVTLAWQARVVRELAARCERVAVLTGYVGPHTVPANVTVEQLARPRGMPFLVRRLLALGQAWRLCRTHRVQAVFIHMAHTNAFLLYPVFRLLRLPVLLWYAHGTVTWHLRLAHACVSRVISSTPEGFRLPSRKVFFIGQGVDTDLFQLARRPARGRNLLTVSRLTRRKRLDLLLAVLEDLRGDGCRLRVVGAPLTADDQLYLRELQAQAAQKSLPVDFAGFIPLAEVPACYTAADLHLNVSATNSLDKTVLEALAAGCPVLTSNPAFRALLKDYPEFIITDERPAAIAAQVRALLAAPQRHSPAELRALIVGRHDLHSYVDRVLYHLKDLATA
jgi:glycosyltransferase involved in cell wall biosynthesis